MIFETEYKPRIQDCSHKGKLKPKAFLDIIEDAGGRHSDAVGDSVLESGAKGVSWILVEWDLKIKRYPVCGEKLKVKTWTQGKAPAVCIWRNYIVTDQEGKECAVAKAKVAIYDFNKGKIARISQELAQAYQPEEESVLETFGKLREPGSYEEQVNIIPRKDDIDYNHHVHNTSYLNFAFEVLSEEACNYEFNSIRIHYKTPVHYGEQLTVKSHKEQETYTIGIYNGDILKTLIELK